MERRKPRSSTADLLAWPETPPPTDPQLAVPTRPRLQPEDNVRALVFGGQVSEEEAESLLKRRPCSGPKWKEMTGSGIFATDNENGALELDNGFSTPNNQTCSRLSQKAASAISQISFNADDNITPKNPMTLTQMAKQRELSGTLDSESDAKMKKQLSNSKCKELSGHDIFGPPLEIKPRRLAIQNNVSVEPVGSPSKEPVIKTGKKINKQKFQELTGNDIFKEDSTPGSAEKPVSLAKLKELKGNDIFANVKVVARDYLGGTRKPPGGESTIALI